MAINLKKGQVLNLSKESNVDLSKGIVLGLGFAANSGTVDLDSWVSVQDEKGKVIEFICYSNLTGEGVKHNGDDTTGGGDPNKPNETIEVNFDKLKEGAHKVILGNSIFTGARNLGVLKSAFSNITQSGTEICRFDMKEDYSNSSTVIIGEFRKSNGEWKFKTRGLGEPIDFRKAKKKYGKGNSPSSSDSSSSSPSSSDSSSSSGNSGGGLFGALKRVFRD